MPGPKRLPKTKEERDFDQMMRQRKPSVWEDKGSVGDEHFRSRDKLVTRGGWGAPSHACGCGRQGMFWSDAHGRPCSRVVQVAEGRRQALAGGKYPAAAARASPRPCGARRGGNNAQLQWTSSRARTASAAEKQVLRMHA